MSINKSKSTPLKKVIM